MSETWSSDGQSRAPARRGPTAAEDGPLVSIVTPCLNPGPRLSRCLASVRSQTYGRVEHIIVDGGSSDETLAVLARAPAIRWLSEADSGQADAINKGFALASGDLLGWLNADDVLAPDGAERAVWALRAHPEAAWAYGDLEVFDDAGRRHVESVPSMVTLEAFDDRCIVQQPGTLVRRAAFDAIGGLDSSLHFSMDYDLWVRLLAEGYRGVHAGGVLATFEVHPESKTGGANTTAWAEEDALVLTRAGRHVAAQRVRDRARWASTSRAVRAALERRAFGEVRDLCRAASSEAAARTRRQRVGLLVGRVAPWVLWLGRATTENQYRVEQRHSV